MSTEKSGSEFAPASAVRDALELQTKVTRGSSALECCACANALPFVLA